MAKNTLFPGIDLPIGYAVRPEQSPSMLYECSRCGRKSVPLISAGSRCNYCRGIMDVGSVKPPTRFGLRVRYVFDGDGKITGTQIPDANGYLVCPEG